jgi:hypothetical protein
MVCPWQDNWTLFALKLKKYEGMLCRGTTKGRTSNKSILSIQETRYLLVH